MLSPGPSWIIGAESPAGGGVAAGLAAAGAAPEAGTDVMTSKHASNSPALRLTNDDGMLDKLSSAGWSSSGAIFGKEVCPRWPLDTTLRPQE
jgi:hypothetical protein